MPIDAADVLLEIHESLFPERYYESAEMYEWTAETIEHVVLKIEQALRDDPRARLEA